VGIRVADHIRLAGENEDLELFAWLGR